MQEREDFSAHDSDPLELDQPERRRERERERKRERMGLLPKQQKMATSDLQSERNGDVSFQDSSAENDFRLQLPSIMSHLKGDLSCLHHIHYRLSYSSHYLNLI